MATLKVHDLSGSEVGSVDIDTEAIAPSINRQLLHDAVVMYQANQRQGTRGAKTRGEVSGSTKKLYRQKGTGNARAGSKRTNVRRGGGTAYTIKTQDHSYRLNKKALRAATRMAIRSKIDDGQTVVVDDFGLKAPKTATVSKALKALGVDAGNVLLVTAETDTNVYKSGRNVPGVSVAPVRELNAFSVLHPKHMVITKAAIDRIADGSFAASETAASETAAVAEPAAAS